MSKTTALAKMIHEKTTPGQLVTYSQQEMWAESFGLSLSHVQRIVEREGRRNAPAWSLR